MGRSELLHQAPYALIDSNLIKLLALSAFVRHNGTLYGSNERNDLRKLAREYGDARWK